LPCWLAIGFLEFLRKPEIFDRIFRSAETFFPGKEAMSSVHTTPAALQSTGIEGLDDVLQGGFSPARMYLVEGDPGSGKTTLALQFLMQGVANGEPGLYVTLSETESELRNSAASHGWDLTGIHILELIDSEESLNTDSRYTMFHPSEVELTQTTQAVLDEAGRVKPGRLVLDSLSSLRLLAQSGLRYRRQLLALKQFFAKAGCTVILIDDRTESTSIDELHTICHGVISLQRASREYGTLRRRMQILKMRGRVIREGFHDFMIKTGGIEVYPRLIAAEHRTEYGRESVSSGLEQLDSMLGGGLSRGTSNLFIGPAGTGKSSVASQYALHSAANGMQSLIYLFDESIATFMERSKGLGLRIAPLTDSGEILVRQVDPAEMTPGEFAHEIRKSVEEDGTKLVILDSLNGYLNAMPSENLLPLHLHELLAFLGQKGVTTIMVMAQHGLLGTETIAPVDMTYLADTVLLFRYFENRGEVRQALSVIKKRTGRHERWIRELKFADDGPKVGEPLTQFQGILAGSPLSLEK
jgi:circadian clock protein KaiC